MFLFDCVIFPSLRDSVFPVFVFVELGQNHNFPLRIFDSRSRLFVWLMIGLDCPHTFGQLRHWLSWRREERQLITWGQFCRRLNQALCCQVRLNLKCQQEAG